MFRVDYREPLQSSDLTEYRIRCNKLIDQILIPQFQCNRKLKRIESTEARVERVTLNQGLRRRKLRFANRENFQFSTCDVSSKLTKKCVRVLAADRLRSNLDRKRRCQFSDRQAANSNQVAGGIRDLIDGQCAGLRVVEFNQRARIEKIPGQGSTFPAVGDDFRSHGSGNFRQPPADFLEAGSRLRVLLLAPDSLDIFHG